MHKIFAQGVDIGKTFSPAASFPTFGDLVSIILKNAFVIAGVIAFILLIITGFRFIVGGGDVKKFEEAKKNISIILVGLVLVASAVWIVQIVGIITGVKELKLLIP
jgi:cytochrome bd-type quinol oxidase subunit 1